MLARRSHCAQGVELNVTAMLDMAFQLLAFFVLTFKPSPVESQLSLRLPTARPVRHTTDAAPDPIGIDAYVPSGVDTLRLGIWKTSGGATDYAVDEQRLTSLGALESRLRQIFAAPDQPFRQVLLEIDGDVAYEQVLAVMEKCTRQKLPGGVPLDRLSLAERPTASSQGTSP
jgi:biopolymer transport protein ExbD